MVTLPVPSRRQVVNPVRPGREQRQQRTRVPGCGWSGRLQLPPERCPSGLRSTPGKCVWVNSSSRVRIPPSPPLKSPNALKYNLISRISRNRYHLYDHIGDLTLAVRGDPVEQVVGSIATAQPRVESFTRDAAASSEGCKAGRGICGSVDDGRSNGATAVQVEAVAAALTRSNLPGRSSQRGAAADRARARDSRRDVEDLCLAPDADFVTRVGEWGKVTGMSREEGIGRLVVRQRPARRLLAARPQ